MALPEYDPAKDGNPFEWILKASAKVRQQRKPHSAAIRNMTFVDLDAAKEYDQLLDRLDAERMQDLRAGYGRKKASRP
jgi:hypothetical protein